MARAASGITAVTHFPVVRLELLLRQVFGSDARPDLRDRLVSKTHVASSEQLAILVRNHLENFGRALEKLRDSDGGEAPPALFEHFLRFDEAREFQLGPIQQQPPTWLLQKLLRDRLDNFRAPLHEFLRLPHLFQLQF